MPTPEQDREDAANWRSLMGEIDALEADTSAAWFQVLPPRVRADTASRMCAERVANLTRRSHRQVLVLTRELELMKEAYARALADLLKGGEK